MRESFGAKARKKYELEILEARNLKEKESTN